MIQPVDAGNYLFVQAARSFRIIGSDAPVKNALRLSQYLLVRNTLTIARRGNGGFNAFYLPC